MTIENGSDNVTSPDFMRSITEYTPRHEWLLVSAYLLRTAGDDTVEFLDYFFKSEADTSMFSEKYAVYQISAALSRNSNSIAAYMRDEYDVPNDVAFAIETSARGLFKKILEYYQEVVGTVQRYVENGFFEKFMCLTDGARAFSVLAWSSSLPVNVDFALYALIDYYMRSNLEVPRVEMHTENDSFDLDPSHIRAAVLGYLIKFFSVYDTKQWGQWDPRRAVQTHCLHLGQVAATESGLYVCMNCKEALTDDEAYNLFHGIGIGLG